ncbi:MAG: T9SS type A sorting domain-containing protein [bacterium]|nr:T9SS type A sorting domain-containing protein [bacterium]
MRLACLAVMLALHVYSWADPLPLPVVSRTLDEGACRFLTTDQHYVLFGTGNNLLILEPDDNLALRKVGSVYTPGVVMALAVSGDYIFVANDHSGLTIVDYSDPREPQVVGTLPLVDRAFDVEVAGDYVFIAEIDYGMQIVDCSDPTMPRVAASVLQANDNARVFAVAVAGNRAYMADQQGVTVLDVGAPEAPAVVSRFPIPSYDIQVRDTIAFVSGNESRRFRAYSIGNPDSLVLLSEVTSLSTKALLFGLSDSRAYVGCEQGGLGIVDISNPRALTRIAQYDPAGMGIEGQGAVVLDGVVYFASHAHGAFSFVESDSNVFEPALAYRAGSAPLELAISGRRLFVANYYSGLTEVDITQPLLPRPVYSSSNTGDFGYTQSVDVFSRDGYLYALSVDAESGIRLLDVTDQNQPFEVSRRSLVDARVGRVLGDNIYICTGNAVAIISVADVHALEYVTAFGVSGTSYDLDMAGDTLYVAARSAGLVAFDVADPYSPQRLWSAALGDVGAVRVDYPYGYLSAADSTLIIVDLSAAPAVQVGRVRTRSLPSGLRLIENLVCVSSADGFYVFDVANPEAPEEVGYRGGLGLGYDVELYDQTVGGERRVTAINASTSGGATLLDITGLLDDTRTSLIVAGGGIEADNFAYFLKNTNASTNIAYTILSRSRGFNAKVAYMNPQSWQDLDGDGVNDAIVTSDVMTTDELRDGILELRDSGNPLRPNVMFISAHGHVDEFDISGDANENVRADSLGAWIDQAGLDAQTPLVFVMEACNSGSFIEEISEGRSNRVFIASGLADEVCSFWNGESFSTKFWEAVWRGETLWQAFDAARAWVAEQTTSQHPILDANGDGIPSDSLDRQIALSIVLGGDSQEGATLPVILDSPAGIDALGDSITVTIVCNGAMENVWYRVFPRTGAYDPAGLLWGEMQSIGQNHYRAFISGLSSLPDSEYLLEFNALDDYVNLALPRVAALHTPQAEPRPELPGGLRALRSYPNPFNTTSTIEFELGGTSRIVLNVWNVLGQQVEALVDREFGAGVHTISWNGLSRNGRALPSGLYFICVENGGRLYTIKSLLLR